MIDWRSLLKAPQYPQNPQNDQNRETGENSADIADSADSELPPVLAFLSLGAQITWQRGDGTARSGVIDFLHAYRGEVWAFCTLPDGGWSAVNAKYCNQSAS